MSKLCNDCKMRKVFDKNNNSFIGKFWRWHINFCPGWKSYYMSLDEEQKNSINIKYNFTKFNKNKI